MTLLSRVILIVGQLMLGQLLFAQYSVQTTRYTVQDGLAQNSVMDMLKGHDQLMWLATKDGLSRFDGYAFKNYKASSKDLNRSVSNQFQTLKQDAAGCLWILNDIGQVLRFDPRKENFTLYPSAEENWGDDYFSVSKMVQLSPSELWLLGSNANGAYRLVIEGDSNVRMTAFGRSEDAHIQVYDVVLDQHNRAWMATDRGVANLLSDTATVVNYINQENQFVAYDLLELPNDWVVASTAGRLYVYDKLKRRFSEKQLDTREDLVHLYGLPHSSYAVMDASNRLFVVRADNSWQEKKIPNSTLAKVWQKGTQLYAKSKVSSAVYQLDEHLNWIPCDKESALLAHSWVDTMGVSWYSSSEGGIEKCVAFNESFRYVDASAGSFRNELGMNDLKNYSPENGGVCALLEDDSNHLWVATSDGYLEVYSSTNERIGALDANGVLSDKEVRFGSVSFIYQDHNHRIWIAGDQLYCLEQQSARKFNVTVCKADSREYSPISLSITDMLEDGKGRLWLSSKDGGLQLLQKTPSGYRFIHKENLFKYNYPPTVEQSHSLMEDAAGNIWLGSSEGLTVFSSDFDEPESIRFFFYNTENTNLTNSCIYDLFQDERGTIWLASFGGGLSCIEGEFVLFQTPQFLQFNKQNKQFPSDLLLNITDDEQGDLWILTEESLVRFDPQSHRSESFGQFRGIYFSAASGRRLVRRRSGALAAAAKRGFYDFRPKEIVATDYQPNVVFTRFLLFNKDVDSQTEKSPLKGAINYEESIVLKHSQSVFSIAYASLDYRFPDHIQYAYKLEPFETEWNYVGTQRMATYTNLPQGEYLFHVRSTNSEGTWYDNDRVLKITVLPSFWRSGWAYLFYALLIALVAGAIAYLYRMKTRMKMEQEMSNSKLQFFTDISHELRTPLTLINAPLENVLENGQLDESDRKQLEVVHTNTNRMLRMMNQILDFRKIQSNKMRLRVEKTNLGQFVSSCSANFLRLAENRNIEFSIDDQTNGANYWVDRDKIDTVLFNLLSNAFKFTPEEKSVRVTIAVRDGKGIVTVADQGCGMAKDKLSVIFDRYTTLQNYSLTKQSGTGIGLSLVKEIVELHKASIKVDSELGVGSTFEITFLPGMNHFDQSADVILSDDTDTENSSEVAMVEPTVNDGKMTLLIVEDNDQLREFLKSVLSRRFTIVEAPNGKVGYETALRELPHFIVTDIMMPVMDGVEMTRKLRSDEQTSHIPIVLLTAKTDMQSKIECLRIGANDYITKPFSMAYLEARIENILQERQKWQERYREGLIRTSDLPVQEVAPEEESESVLDPKDDEMMKQFIALIHQNMDNTEFSVEDVQEHLKISRWHLLSKVKSLVGLTPAEFIRETRLSHAAQLIEEGELNMTQVAYMIGISDSRYFSRCFKQKFGMTPTEYKEQKAKR